MPASQLHKRLQLAKCRQGNCFNSIKTIITYGNRSMQVCTPHKYLEGKEFN